GSNESSSAAASVISGTPGKRERVRRFVSGLRRRMASSLLPYLAARNRTVTVQFNNYLGMGVDGDLTHTYHQLRKTRPYLFLNRLVNKALYAAVWVYKFFYSNRKLLSHAVSLEVDGQSLDLSDLALRGLVFASIGSYAGGSVLYQPGTPLLGSNSTVRGTAQRSDDGVLEIVGLYGLPHLAQITGGLARAVSIAQGREIKVSLKVTIAVGQAHKYYVDYLYLDYDAHTAGNAGGW
ncbi:hypothetical protein EON64_18535, partial [archaeon]